MRRDRRNKIGRIALIVFSILLVVQVTNSQTTSKDRSLHSPAASPAPEAVPKVAFEKYVLPNGLQVILHVDRKLPVVHVNQWFHVGSQNERVGRSGFAHLFEHMMFEGSKNAPDRYFTYAEKFGANVFEGGVNGTTSWDRTNYFATVSSGNLESLLWLESDRLSTLGEALTLQRLDNQRDVVKNERRQGLENQPYGKWLKLICENMYPYHHPYANDVIGSHEDLSAATLADVKEFFETYYRPSNLSLVIAGDFDPAEAKRLVEKYFSGIPAGPPLDRPPHWIPHLDGEKIVEAMDRVPQERTYLAWHSPAYFEAGDEELDMVAGILTDGLSARLNKILVYTKQICSDVVSFQFSRESASAFIIWATARPGASLSTIEHIVTEEIARLAKEGPTTAELNRARNKWEYGFVTGLERIGGFGGKADRLNQYNTFLGDPNKFEADVARYRKVTIDDVRQVVAKWLNTRNRLIVRFHPETSGRDSNVAIDRSKQPPLGMDRPFSVPEIKSAKLENGLQIFVVERPDLPKVAVSLVTKSGSVFDPAGKVGCASLMVTTVKMGTKTKKALEIEDAMGDLGTSIGGNADRERSSLGFEVLKRNLAPAMAIFADVVRNPVFPDSEVARERKLRLDALAQEAKDPNAIAFRVGSMLAFGADHPYGRVDLPSTVERITREDLVRFHDSNWKPGGSALIFAGDISLDEAASLARQNFGEWSGPSPASPAIPQPQPAAAGKIYIVDRQDAAQTVILEMLSGAPRKTEDYYALRLADAVYGGGVSTRLMLNLREDKGYSYGVFSSPVFYSKDGFWFVSGGFHTEKTKVSVSELMKELKSIGGEKPVSNEELANAKAMRLRGYAQQFESLGRIAGQIAELWSFDLPMSEMQRETGEIEKASLDSVNSAAQKYARPSEMKLLLVGDRSKIEAGLRELTLGELVFLDAEGKPVGK